MNKELLITQYILSRKYYLEGELKRYRATFKEFERIGEGKYYERMLGRLEGMIGESENELDALRELEKKLKEGDEE